MQQLLAAAKALAQAATAFGVLVEGMARMPPAVTGAGPGDNDNWITVAEAKALIGVSDRTVYDALRKGRMRGRRFGRNWRTKVEWVEEFGRPQMLAGQRR